MLGLVQGKDGVVRGMVLLHKRHSITNLFRKCAHWRFERQVKSAPRKQRGRDEAQPRKKECRVPQLKRSSKNLNANANANASIITVNIVGVNYRVVVIDWLQTQDRLQTHFSFEGRSK